MLIHLYFFIAHVTERASCFILSFFLCFKFKRHDEWKILSKNRYATILLQLSSLNNRRRESTKTEHPSSSFSKTVPQMSSTFSKDFSETTCPVLIKFLRRKLGGKKGKVSYSLITVGAVGVRVPPYLGHS